ncbi:MAG: phosphomevalonate kinase [Candidatus Aenigmarchaeota archaeon]|nr:phosphomevalonate kinase [Candidatus Aenigmarchaeota archaeon]
MVEVSAPGKLFLSGEWSVLEVGNPGIVTAVDKKVFARVEDSDKIIVTVDDFKIENVEGEFDGDELKWKSELTEDQREKLIFIKGAIETTLKYLGEYKPFKIRSWGELSQIEVDGEVKKIGFGSSAAAVVVAVASLLAFNGKDISTRETKDVIYKLSTIAHYFAQGKVGSGFDVAASTFGGVFVYKRFDPDWLLEQLKSGKSVKEITEMEWPSYLVEELEIPEDLNFIVGWTKESASTSAMVKQLDEWAKSHQDEYKRLYNQIANLVRDLIPVWKEKNREKILELISKNEDYLRELGEKSGVNIETPDLKKLSDIANNNGGAGKLSGAGGGDCGFAITFDKESAEKIKNEWEEAGLHFLDVKMAKKGVG